MDIGPFHLQRVSFIAIYPRIRVTDREIEIVWLGIHASRFRTNTRPIKLLYGGKHIMNDWPKSYTPEGFTGGTLADFIPKGMYCYEYKQWRKVVDDAGFEYSEPIRDSHYRCPFWDSDLGRPEQMNGYCHLINDGDWNGTMLLWDQCKECNHKYEEDEVD